MPKTVTRMPRPMSRLGFSPRTIRARRVLKMGLIAKHRRRSGGSGEANGGVVEEAGQGEGDDGEQEEPEEGSWGEGQSVLEVEGQHQDKSEQESGA